MINTDHNRQTLEPATNQKIVKVLLIAENSEDYILVKNLIGESLYSYHYSLVWCNSYTEAINAMLKRHHDLYLVDYKLGRHTGINLLHEAIRSNCTEPIIILSAKADIKTDEEALRIGATDYLVKENIDSYTLERSMRYALGHNISLKNLINSENKFRTIFERSKYPIIISDYSGKLYDANPAAVKFFELPLEKLLAANDKDFYPTLKDREGFVQAMEDQGSVSDLEFTLLLPNGKTKFCSISSFVQISQHGTSILYHSIINDLTSRKEQEQSLANEMQNPLSNVNLALNELNTNLNGQSESLKRYVNIVKENCDRIEQLTKKFISIS